MQLSQANHHPNDATAAMETLGLILQAPFIMPWSTNLLYLYSEPRGRASEGIVPRTCSRPAARLNENRPIALQIGYAGVLDSMDRVGLSAQLPAWHNVSSHPLLSPLPAFFASPFRWPKSRVRPTLSRRSAADHHSLPGGQLYLLVATTHMLLFLGGKTPLD